MVANKRLGHLFIALTMLVPLSTDQPHAAEPLDTVGMEIIAPAARYNMSYADIDVTHSTLDIYEPVEDPRSSGADPAQ